MSKKVYRTSTPEINKIVPDVPTEVTTASTGSGLTKWVPIILAGAALGVSVVAIKELKNVRKELTVMKNTDNNSELIKRMELMDQQLLKISEFLSQQKGSNPAPPPTPTPKKKSSLGNNYPINVNVVNEQPLNKLEEVVEYEEVEVTDSESEDS